MKGFAIAIAFSLFGTNAFADEVSFYEGDVRFRITVPPGWQQGGPRPKQNGELMYFMASPRWTANPESGGVCWVFAEPKPKTKDMGQRDINAVTSRLLTSALQNKNFLAGFGMKDVFDSGQKVHDQLRQAYFIVGTAVIKFDAKELEATSKLVVHNVPGASYFVSCTAAKAAWAAMTPTFEEVFASFQAAAPFEVEICPEDGNGLNVWGMRCDP